MFTSKAQAKIQSELITAKLPCIDAVSLCGTTARNPDGVLRETVWQVETGNWRRRPGWEPVMK